MSQSGLRFSFLVGDEPTPFVVNQEILKRMPKLKRRVDSRASEDRDSLITVPDVDATHFSKILKFIRSGVLNIRHEFVKPIEDISIWSMHSFAAFLNDAPSPDEMVLSSEVPELPMWLFHIAFEDCLALDLTNVHGLDESWNSLRKRKWPIRHITGMSFGPRGNDRIIVSFLEDGVQSTLAVTFWNSDDALDFMLYIHVLMCKWRGRRDENPLSFIPKDFDTVFNDNPLSPEDLFSTGFKRRTMASMLALYTTASRVGCEEMRQAVVALIRTVPFHNEDGTRTEMGIRIMMGYDEQLTTGPLSLYWLETGTIVRYTKEELDTIVEGGLVKDRIKKAIMAELRS